QIVTQLASSLQSHYVSALLRQLYKIVGSFDFLGDPVGSFSQLGTGVKDFFFEPAEGLLKSPTAFGRGVAKGTMSLVGNTTSGVLGFTTKITRSVGGGVAALSFDEEFQQRRIRLRREAGTGQGKGARGAALLMGRAAQDLGGGIYHGVTGVVLEPYRRAKNGGWQGLTIGLCQGVAGVATKPMVGCLDAVAHTGEAVREMAGGLARRDGLYEAQRKRMPQPFGLDGRMMPRIPETACGAMLLARFPMWTVNNSSDMHSRDYETVANFPTLDSSSRELMAERGAGGRGYLPSNTSGTAVSSAERPSLLSGESALSNVNGLSEYRGCESSSSPGELGSLDNSHPSPYGLNRRQGPKIMDQSETKAPKGGRGGGSITNSGWLSIPKACAMRRNRHFEHDYVVSTEILRLGGGNEVTVLVVSNQRVLCVKATRGGPGDISTLELEWEIPLNSLVGLPALLDEGGGGATLDFSNVVAADEYRRRDGKMYLRRANPLQGRAGGWSWGVGGTEGRWQSVFGSSPVGGSQVARPLEHIHSIIYSGSAVDRTVTRRLVGQYRDRPALIRVYNAVACLTQQLGHVILTPGGRNVGGASVVIQAQSGQGRQGGGNGSHVGNGLRRGGRGTDNLGVISINGWEFEEDMGGMMTLASKHRWTDARKTARCNASSMQSPRGAPMSLFRSGGGSGQEDPVEAVKDLWLPLQIPFADSAGLAADKLRIVPNTFEMDVVPWHPGPVLPDFDLSMSWQRTVHLSALRAPEDACRVAVESEFMVNDTPLVHDIKDNMQQGKLSASEFRQKMAELRHKGLDQIQSGPSTGVGRSSVRSGNIRDIGGHDGAGRGLGAGQGLKRYNSSTGVLSKLSERLAIGLSRVDQTGQASSPAPESRKERKFGRSNSPKEGAANPKGAAILHPSSHALSASEAAGSSAGSGWSWGEVGRLSINNSIRQVRSALIGPPSPQKPAPTPPGQHKSVWGQGTAALENSRSVSPSPRRIRGKDFRSLSYGGSGASGGHARPSSEFDNMSSVSNSSTALTDISTRLEKIEDMLSRLLE
ncbi:unnamed protein product, partial [Choristocarpus tenellus]